MWRIKQPGLYCLASPGDTIVIAESPISEPAIRIPPRTKDLTIESGLPGGKPAIIEFISSGGSASLAMFELTSTENIRFKGLELDGKGVADFGIAISGNAPGVTLENVSVRGVKSAPFRLSNVAGQAGRPVVLDRVRAVMALSNDAGILVTVPTGATTETKYLSIRNGRVDGPGKVGVKFEGALLDVEVIGNRFYKLDSAIVMSRVAEGRPYKAQVNQNTIYESKIGFQFAGAGGGTMSVTVNRNYFAKTAAIVDGPGVVGIGASENGQRESGPGNGPVPAQLLDAPQLPPPNPDDDATFLRFPGAGPLIGANRVGAN